MRKIILISVAAPILLVLSVYGCIRVANPNAGYENIRISKETTHVVEPLDETGMVDFLEALNQRMSAGVTPENNAAVLLWQAWGPGEMPEELRPELFRRLGIEPLPDKADYFISFDDFVEANPELLPNIDEGEDIVDEIAQETLVEEQFDQAKQRPWSADEFPIIAAWLEQFLFIHSW